MLSKAFMLQRLCWYKALPYKSSPLTGDKRITGVVSERALTDNGWWLSAKVRVCSKTTHLPARHGDYFGLQKGLKIWANQETSSVRVNFQACIYQYQHTCTEIAHTVACTCSNTDAPCTKTLIHVHILLCAKTRTHAPAHAHVSTYMHTAHRGNCIHLANQTA